MRAPIITNRSSAVVGGRRPPISPMPDTLPPYMPAFQVHAPRTFVPAEDDDADASPRYSLRDVVAPRGADMGPRTPRHVRMNMNLED